MRKILDKGTAEECARPRQECDRYRAVSDASFALRRHCLETPGQDVDPDGMALMGEIDRACEAAYGRPDAKLHYYRVPEDWTREQKLEFLRTHTILTMTPEQEAAQAEQERRRRDAPPRYPVRRPAKPVRAAAEGYARAFRRLRTMGRANPGHTSLPGMETRLEEAREALFVALRFEDRHSRRAFLVKQGL